MNKTVSLLLLTVLGAAQRAAENTTLDLRSGPRQTALVELFTSEGCSSCPPAEKWLGEFVDQPSLWRDFVPVVWPLDSARLARVAWISRRGEQAPIQAVGGWWTPGK